MSMTQAASEYFGRVAGNWDAISAGYFGKAVREMAIAKAYLRPEMSVADIGAGTGFLAAGLAPLVRRVHVVDASAQMLDVARKNLSQFANVEYHLADGLRLPFADGSLDAVFANMYLHHVVEPLEAIREMARVLRPGGRLVITDMDAHPYTWLKDEMADVWQGFAREQMRGWLEQAGLVNRVVDGSGQSCCAESNNPVLADARGRAARVSVFVATGTTRLVMRDAVRENYAAVAKSGSGCGCNPTAEAESGCCGETGSAGGSCCGGSAYEDISISGGYSDLELSAAPEEAAQISLGCGNPLAMANLQPGEVVLDIGSGGGLDAFLAADKVGPSGRVIGVDMTPAMLERARASARRNGFHNVEFRQGYAEELPVEDGSVDVILSNCVINLAEDKGHVFAEAFRVLKPGGRLEVSDIVSSAAMPRELQADAQGWSECITSALPESEYLDLIRQAGFQKVITRRSAGVGQTGGVSVYSAVVSARKPAGEQDCGCGSGCCG
jgi:ubiquinone/menaquinone biosynthesis C-methylase UbiE